MDFHYVDRDDIKKWQLATFEIQQDIQSLFEKVGIDGWCGGGTLIGAVRDKGFLYWDNDMDMFFMFKDIKKIILAFWEERVFDRYKLFHFKDGFWQENYNLVEAVNGATADKTLLDFEIEELSRGMFKLFAKTGVNIKIYDNDFNEPEKYVKIKCRAPVHFTRRRLAYQNDNIVNGNTYTVMPNLCMLPMIEMTYSNYLNFIYRFSLSRLFLRLSDYVQYSEVTLDKYCPLLVKPRIKERSGFDPKASAKFSQKTKLLLSALKSANLYYLKTIRKRFSHRHNGKFIAYKPIDFRFLVRPYSYEDVFPLQKIPFENGKISVPHNINEVLSTQFNDYMTVPGIDSRIAYPFFFEDKI